MIFMILLQFKSKVSTKDLLDYTHYVNIIWVQNVKSEI